MPFFSIITVSFNAENVIRETVESVLEQTFKDFEIIVKDAASTDATLSRVPKDDRIKIYSEKDNGIYSGMNSAIHYATGEYLLFLNCGDLLADTKVLAKFYAIAHQQKKEAVLYGDYVRDSIYYRQTNHITDFHLFCRPLCHQSMFFPKKLFITLGGYDETYQICADYAFTVKCFMSDVDFVYSSTPVCTYLPGGVSENVNNRRIKKEEYKQIIKTYYSPKKQFWYSCKVALSLKPLRQKIASENSPLWLRKLYRRFVNSINH